MPGADHGACYRCRHGATDPAITATACRAVVVPSPASHGLWSRQRNTLLLLVSGKMPWRNTDWPEARHSPHHPLNSWIHRKALSSMGLAMPAVCPGQGVQESGRA